MKELLRRWQFIHDMPDQPRQKDLELGILWLSNYHLEAIFQRQDFRTLLFNALSQTNSRPGIIRSGKKTQEFGFVAYRFYKKPFSEQKPFEWDPSFFGLTPLFAGDETSIDLNVQFEEYSRNTSYEYHQKPILKFHTHPDVPVYHRLAFSLADLENFKFDLTSNPELIDSVGCADFHSTNSFQN